jgi:hypothetical protein
VARAYCPSTTKRAEQGTHLRRSSGVRVSAARMLAHRRQLSLSMPPHFVS